ncbi:uncharacterized protein LOC107457740 [Arachis duranensis]|uniref:Uncharacterized protein LOC107457740 n=1 Tax=Arachis duranensis TaxID=130453 RepID=A0A6P4AVA4_ARADU|nr:uncharacterized protein LOC107457740 [Arachis duranensis]
MSFKNNGLLPYLQDNVGVPDALVLECREGFTWRRELFQWELELVNQLHERLRTVTLADGQEDYIVWKFDCKGIFSTNSVVKVLQSETLSAEVTSYSFTSAVWRGVVPPRIELFGWFVLVGRVNTKERLTRLGVILPTDNICVLCKKELVEDWVIPGTVRELFESWTSWHKRKQEQKRRLTGFFAVIWNIWVERNARIFNDKETGVDFVIRRTIQSYNEWSASASAGC